MPRWAVALGGALVIGAGLAGPFFLEGYNRYQSNRAEQVISLLDDMVGFQKYATAFANELMDGKVSPETKSALIQNLNEQYAKLQIIGPLVPESYLSAINGYKDKILRMNDAVLKSDSILTMKDFWNAAGNLTSSRNVLNKELQKLI